MLNREQSEKCPCKGCVALRTEDCHTRCGAYLAWDKAYRAEREVDLRRRNLEWELRCRRKSDIRDYHRKRRQNG